MRQFYSILLSTIIAAHLLTPSQELQWKRFNPFEQRRKKIEEKIKQQLPVIQNKVDAILQKRPKTADELVENLSSVGIKAVVVVQEKPTDERSDLKSVETSARKKGLKFETLLWVSGPLVLPKRLQKIRRDQVLVIDPNQVRRQATSKLYPVATSKEQFTLNGLRQSFSLPKSHTLLISQGKVNSFISKAVEDGTLRADTLVNKLVELGIRGFVFKLDGVVTSGHAVSDATEDFLDIARQIVKSSHASPNLWLYVVISPEQKILNTFSDEKRKSGKSSVLDALFKETIVPASVFVYSIGLKHLVDVQNHSGLGAHQIVWFDSNMDTCQGAAASGYNAVHVKGNQGFRFTALAPVASIPQYDEYDDDDE